MDSLAPLHSHNCVLQTHNNVTDHCPFILHSTLLWSPLVSLWMVLCRFLQIFRVDTGLRFLKAIVMFLKEILEHFSSLSHVGGCLLPIVRSYSWFPPSRTLFLGLHALNLSPKEVKIFHRKIGVPPWYFPPHPQLEPKQPVVAVSGWESFFALLWTFHLHICRFIGKRPLQEQRTCEMAAAQAPGTWVLVLAVPMPGCCSSICLHLSLFQKGCKFALYYRKNAKISYKREEGERRQENRGWRKKWSWEWQNHKYKPLCTCIWPKLTLKFLVVRRQREILWARYFISKSQFHRW